MRQIIGYIVIIGGLLSFGLALDIDTHTNEDTPREYINTEKIFLKNRRETLQSEKQELKQEMLKLYKQLRHEDEKESKKEVKQQISQLKKELRVANSKIAQTYKQEIKELIKK